MTAQEKRALQLCLEALGLSYVKEEEVMWLLHDTLCHIEVV